MKIILPVNEENIESGICDSFGRAPYFLLWDTVKDSAVYMENQGAASSGGAGIKAAQVVVDQAPDVLLVPRIGKNASDVIEAAKVQLFKSINTDIKENIQLMIENKLEVLTDIHPGFHHGGE